MTQKNVTQTLLNNIMTKASKSLEGETADYIPELANANHQLTAISVHQLGGPVIHAETQPTPPVTLQSVAKLIPLIGLLEEYGVEYIQKWVLFEPSGADFASITRLEQFGPKPCNPMLNTGAITLCSLVPGVGEQKLAWMQYWVKTLFGEKLNTNPMVLASERRTGDRNRSIAYLLKSRDNLCAGVTETLDLYFMLCSYEATPKQMLHLAAILANGGMCPTSQQQLISSDTTKTVLALMATCGLYDDTGTHMVRCGMPAKSGVSGYILATLPNKAGIVTLSPLVNAKGNSIRGSLMLELLSRKMNWHFALP